MRHAPPDLRPVPAAMGGARGAAVVVDRLTWRPYGRAAPVLPGLSLRIEPGERVLLVGPSGCGKSTLLRALAGLLEVADAGERSGQVSVDGDAPTARPGLVGLVMQDPGAGVVAASLDSDVAFGPENLAMPRAEMAPLVTSALRRVRLGICPDVATSSLSGGEQQRLALAGALALRPRLLLLDEPTSMLDPGHAAAVRSSIREVVEADGLTAVVVEHQLAPWVDFCDRLVVLDAGGLVVADGPVAGILQERGDWLLAQGIWVPGAAPPQPLSLPADLFGQPPVPAGAEVMSAQGVGVTRRTRSLNRPERVVDALDDACVLAVAGSTRALVGPSGSGKSTLLAALGGLLEPSAGSVSAHEALRPAPESASPSSWPSSELASRIAWVPQSPSATVVRRTVLDEVLATPLALGLENDDVVRTRADTLLRVLGLEAVRTLDPRLLSGGEQRRLAMAAAVVHQPALLLTDEPTIGQDRLTWSAVMGVSEALRRSGSAVLHATHDDDVVVLSERVTRLSGLRQPSAVPAQRRLLAARAGPLALVLASMLSLPAALAVDGPRAGLVALAVAVLLSVPALSSRGPGARPSGRVLRLLRRFSPAALGAVSVGWSTWLLGGHDLAVAAGALIRVLVLAYPSAALLPLVDADRLAEHVAQRLRLPARPVVAAAAALNRVQSLGELWTELAMARRARGLGTGRSPYAKIRYVASLTFAAMVDSLTLAGRLAVAMDARGFASARRRSWLRQAPWHVADTVVVLLGALVPIAALLA